MDHSPQDARPAKRTRAWSSQETRDIIREAAWALLQEYAAEGKSGFELLTVTAVLTRAKEIWREQRGPQGPAFTTGSFYNSWEDLDSMLAELLSEKFTPDGMTIKQQVVEPLRERLDALADLPATEAQTRTLELFQELARGDVNDMLSNFSTTRVWLQTLARAHMPAMQTVIQTVYAQYDALLTPLYQALLDQLGRRPKEDIGLPGFATAITAMHEGLAFRALVDGNIQPQEKVLHIAASTLPGLIDALTEPTQ